MSRLLLILFLAFSPLIGCGSKRQEPERVKVKIQQRRELPVPGTKEEAFVGVSDIRNGTLAVITVSDDMGKVVASETMRKGETMDFEFYSLKNKSTLHYQLRVDRYQDGIVDYAYLSFTPLP